MNNSNGSVKVTKEKIYEEVQGLKSTVEIFISKIETQLTPEFKAGSCPYKKTINGMWKSVGIFSGIAAVVGGIFASIFMKVIF